MKFHSTISSVLSLGLWANLLTTGQAAGDAELQLRQDERSLRLPDCIFSNLQLRLQVKRASSDPQAPSNIVFCGGGTFVIREQIDLTGKSLEFSCAVEDGCLIQPNGPGVRAFYGNPVYAGFQDLWFRNFDFDLRKFSLKKRWCDFARPRRFLGWRCPEFDEGFETLGGAMFFTGGVVNLNDVTFTDNDTIGAGAAVSMTRGGTLTLNRPLMSKNQFQDLYTGDRPDITGLERGGGGAVYLSDSSLKVLGAGSNCLFQFNKGLNGGVLYAKNSEVDINGCTFYFNEAVSDGFGGSIAFENTKAMINNTFFKEGKSFSAVDPHGDELYIFDDLNPTLDGSNITCLTQAVFCNNITDASIAESGNEFSNTNCPTAGLSLTNPTCNLINERLF